METHAGYPSRAALSSPLCFDVQINNREDFELAYWLSQFPRFFHKGSRCTVRVVYFDSYRAQLEILRF